MINPKYASYKLGFISTAGVVFAGLAIATLSACAQDVTPGEASATVWPSLFYGEDNRVEAYRISEHSELGPPVAATVALFDTSALRSDGAGGFALVDTTPFSESHDVCDDEPFATQPTPAFCSGVLVGPDLIATAGHCVGYTGCADTMFVFGFGLDAPNSLRTAFGADDVYACQEVVGRAESSTNDYAILRLDRTVQGRDPVRMLPSGDASVGDEVVLLGHPAGLPLKVAGNATVRDTSDSTTFHSNVDAYGGNSGSPIVTADDGALVGLLVRGNDDFVRRRNGDCFQSNQCPNDGCPGWEQATKISSFRADILDPQPFDCDDAREPNDDEPSATPITWGQYRELRLCGDDEDWFYADLPSGTAFRVEAEFSHERHDLDVGVYDGEEFIATSESETDNELASGTVQRTDGVWIVVYGFNDGLAEYSLTLHDASLDTRCDLDTDRDGVANCADPCPYEFGEDCRRGDDDEPDDCGCATSSAAAWLAWLPLLWLRRRQRADA